MTTTPARSTRIPASTTRRSTPPVRTKFLTLYPTEIRSLIRSLAASTSPALKLTPSPSGSYARAGHNGHIIAYFVPGQRGVRVLIRPTLLPAKDARFAVAEMHEIANGQRVTTLRPTSDPKQLDATQDLLRHAASRVASLHA